MVSCKPVMSVEANEECEKRINSVGYYVGVDGKFLRVQERDFLLCAYTITNTDGKVKLTENPNKEKVKYVI